MFGKLKNKLKEWANKVSEVEGEDSSASTHSNANVPQENLEKESKTTEEIIEVQEKEVKKPEEEKTKEKGFFKKLFSKKEETDEEDTEESKGITEKIENKPTDKKEETNPISKETSKIEDKEAEETKNKKVDKKPEEKEKKEDAKEPPKETDKDITTETKDEDKEVTKLIPKDPTRDSDGRVGTKEKEEPEKGFFKKLLSSKKIMTEEEFMGHSEDLEMILLENNVALEVSDKIIEELKNNIVGKELSKKEIEDTIASTLKEIIESVLIEPFDIIEEIKNKDGPYIMIFCGINGVGKTTSIAKFAHMLKEKGISSVMAAADTFRAAAIEQLKIHGDKLDIKVISHEYGSDPAAVGFDAVKHAKKNNIDVVLIDTAGRIHTATNLLQEMAKIKKVCKPDRTIFLGESITGNDSVDQIKAFNENIGIDGIILSKADIDEKGGTALSVGYVTKKPILYLGTGQNYEDIEPFNKQRFIEKLGL